MSKAHHDEALQWHWLYIPSLFLVFAVGPSVLAPIFFVLSLFVDVSPIVGPVQRAPDLISILVFPLLLGLMFWPFLWLWAHWPRDRVNLVALPPQAVHKRLRDGRRSAGSRRGQRSRTPVPQPPVAQKHQSDSNFRSSAKNF
jgi:hypothetical protein